MAELVLVNCKQEENKKEGLYHKLISLLDFLRRNKDVSITLRKKEINELLTLCVAELPYTIPELNAFSLKKKRILIDSITRLSGSESIYLPDLLAAYEDAGKLLRYRKAVNIFRANILNISKLAFEKIGKKLGDMNLLFIQGGDRAEMFELIRMLAPCFRYISAVVDDREQAEEAAETIYDEYGLPVGLYTEVRRAVKGADIIISLATASTFEKNLRVGPDTVVLDLMEEGITARLDGGMVIKGMEAHLSEVIVEWLGKDILSNYDSTRLAEIITMMSSGFYPGTVLSNQGDLKRISSSFLKLRMCISGLVGRHNVLKV